MTISRRALFGKLNLTLFRGIESATAFAKLRGNPYVELTHWIHQLWQLNDSDLHRICRHYQIDAQAIEKDFTSALSSLPSGATSLTDFSSHIEAAIERAWVLSSLEFGAHCVRGAWLLAALLQTPDLRRVLLGISPAFQRIPADQLTEAIDAIVAGSPEGQEGPHDGSGLPSALPGEASAALADAASDGKSALRRYCTDLTERASQGRIDPVIGRGHEIRTMVDILLRRRQNNPLLTGDAGVGKTAVVEGLALAIAQGEVPPDLKNCRLWSLDVGALLAGASMRGEFESRLKALLEEAGKSVQPIILFIDEVHTLVGAGGQSGTGDAANLLKPALARGTLRTIGATTWSEYKRHIEKDPALTRRFQTLQVAEPDEISAIEMVRGLVATFAEHHGVLVLDEAVRAAVTLSHRYIPARQLPDKAISLLDTACARVAMSLHAPPPDVEQWRHRIAALQVELELLGQEGVVAQGSDARALRLDKARSQLDAAQQALTLHEARWQDELALVRTIHGLRTKKREEAKELSCAEGNAPSAQLEALELELAAHQQELPLIFPQVDEAVVAGIVADWTGIPVGRMPLAPDALRDIVSLHLDRVVDRLSPFSAAAPCGPSLEYDAEYAVLLARMSPRGDAQYGQFVGAPDAPNWAEIERDCRRLLLRTRDINLFVWLCRARTRLAQAAGLAQSLVLLVEALRTWPEAVHPQLVIEGERDPAVRANALAALADPEARFRRGRQARQPVRAWRHATTSCVTFARPGDGSRTTNRAVLSLCCSSRPNA
ncbi:MULTISPECIES: type VI secretion system ImpA family N-terminal domain-containing protein [unclassified Variovorax]|uniref:type VI secretion system ImpA family N-terminal domain-containing protein n=1 Tax=unclassified Variovorax TaxID=663243 RepID=UPI0032E74390